MKAWVLKAAQSPLELIEREDPTPGEGEVVLDIRAAGLCHSDVAEMNDPNAGQYLPLPVIPGHEMAGTVSAIGEGVTDWKIGDRVAVCPTADERVPGYFRDGGFATKHLSPAYALVPIPDNVSWSLGAMMTDAGMTSYHALVKRGGLKEGMKVGIIGFGGLGQIATRVAVLKGAEVHVAEVKKDVWPVIEELGVTNIVESASEWARQGFDLIVDYAGYPGTTADAIRAVKFNGTVVLVGLGVDEITIGSNDMVSNAVSLLASRGGTKEDIVELYEMVASGDLQPVVTEITFDDIPQGLKDLADHKVTGRLVAMI